MTCSLKYRIKIFVLETANRDEIISEIASRIGLSTSEIKNIMEVEIEEGAERRTRTRRRRDGARRNRT